MARGRDEPEAGVLIALYSMSRLVGFLLLAGLALVILAAILLLPAYTEMRMAQHHLNCEKLRYADMTSMRAATERLITAVEDDDEVTLKRLAAASLGFKPTDEIALPPDPARASSKLLVLPPQDLPPTPNDWMIRASSYLEDPQKRRGLLALAGASMLVAVVCFSGPEKYRRRQKTAAG